MLNTPLSSRLRQRGAVIPIALFLFLVGLLLVLVRMSNREPAIEAVAPHTIEAGETLEVRGRFFGAEGTVLIGSRRLPRDAVISWSPERIEMRTSSSVSSGLVYVTTDTGRSNGVFVSVSNDLPQVSAGGIPAEAPRIDAITPSQAQIGELVRLTGRRFGAQRNGSRVLFQWSAGEPEAARLREPLGVSEFDYGYEFWSEREIVVRVPDGAVSGTVVVDSGKGRSNEVAIDIVREVGSKVYEAPRSFALYHDVAVSGVELGGRRQAAVDPRIYLWVPKLQTLPAQRDVQLLRREGGTPLFSDTVPGLYLYELGPERLTGAVTIGHAYLFRRYAVETAVITQLVPREYDMSERFLSRYTAATDSLPVGGEYAAATVRRLVGSGGNPYREAEILYGYVVDFLAPSDEIGNIAVGKGVAEQRGNAYTYAALYTTLLRQAAVPARMVSGAIFSDDGEAIRHYWSEFYIPGIGWIPADPSLGDGLHRERFTRADEPRSYYFGNLDARRVTFAPGRLQAEKLSPHGTPVRIPEMYSLQRYHEERVGPVRSYRSRWYSLILLGEYDI